MKLTGICHFYNEEYLLPYWITHHKSMFDDMIFINYHSTDKSVSIIEEMWPDADCIDTINPDFTARSCDDEVQAIEEGLDGYKIALNVTEFLIGNVKKMISSNAEQYMLPVYAMIDSIEDEFTELDPTNKNLIEQRTFGINFARGDEFFNIRRARLLHRMPFLHYPTGRHFKKYTTDECVICWYGYSPFNEHTIKRKLQIQSRIPESDKKKELGIEHCIDREKLVANFRNMQQHAEDLSDKFKLLL